MQITLEIPEAVAQKLARVARQDEKAVEQVAAECLADALRDIDVDLPQRYAEILGIIDSPPHLTDEERRMLDEAIDSGRTASPVEKLFGE